MEDKYPFALPQGTVLAGQYVIEKTLGQGGFGITYRAKDHKSGQPVAVKEFFPDAMATRTNQTTVTAFTGDRGESFAYGKTCFLQEAETLAQFIGNESIVRIHTYFEENGTAYFVMDYVEGISFDEYIKNKGGKISYEDAERILLPVIDALAAVHSKGIVHRDVTPDNIYITKDGKVKLLDFGAARYSLGDKSRSLDVVLKHGFAPKEQYTRRGKQGPFTDVYTVGATFYFAITGKRPPDSIERMDEDDLVPPSSRGVSISKEKEEAILMALSVQPQDRFQTMAAFKRALLQADAQPMPNVQSMPGAQPVPNMQPMSNVQSMPGVQPMPNMQPQLTRVEYTPNPPYEATGNIQPALNRVEYQPGGTNMEKPSMKQAEDWQGTVGMSRSEVPATASLETLIKRGKVAIEDQEWEKADGFFENALNLDADHAEAYLGKLMVEKKVSTIEALLLTYMEETNQLIREEVLSCKEAENWVALADEAVKKYTVPGFLDESYIREKFYFDPKYSSEVSYRKKMKEMTENAMESDKKLCRVRTLAPKLLSDQLEDAIDALKASLYNEIVFAQEKETSEVNRIKEAYQKHMEQAEEQLHEEYDRAVEKREQNYQMRSKTFHNATTLEDYLLAKKALASIGDYKDSEELLAKCQEEIDRLKQEEKKEIAKEIYNKNQPDVKIKEKKKKKPFFVGRIILAIIILVVVGIVVWQRIGSNDKSNHDDFQQSIGNDDGHQQGKKIKADLGSYKQYLGASKEDIRVTFGEPDKSSEGEDRYQTLSNDCFKYCNGIDYVLFQYDASGNVKMYQIQTKGTQTDLFVKMYTNYSSLPDCTVKISDTFGTTYTGKNSEDIVNRMKKMKSGAKMYFKWETDAKINAEITRYENGYFGMICYTL